MTRRRLLAVAVAAALSLAGCAGESATPRFSGVFGSLYEDALNTDLGEDSQTLEFLEDGQVTLEEYRQAFANSLACLNAHGVFTQEPYVNKFDGWRLMWEPDVERSNPEGGEDWSAICSQQHTFHVEIGYSLVADDRVDARLLAHASECLESIGGALSGSERSIADLTESTGDGEQVRSCLFASLEEIYPGETAAYVEPP